MSSLLIQCLVDQQNSPNSRLYMMTGRAHHAIAQNTEWKLGDGCSPLPISFGDGGSC